MATVTSVLVLVALAGFLVLSAMKFAKYSKLSQHSRFDLYPVPKEGAGRGAYGGSYLEEDEWWRKERSVDRGAEMLDVLKEMFLIRTLFVNQRSLWVQSFLLHGGIYAMMLWSLLLIPAAFWRPAAFAAVVGAVGVVGFSCAGAGAASLLLRRIFDKALAVYTTPAEYFNLALIVAVLATGAYAWLAVADPLDVAHSVLTLDVAGMPAAVTAHLVLMSAMMLYIPASKMGHYAGKFFSFRSVMWDNDPNLPGSKVDARVQASNAVGAKAAWSAHAKPREQAE